MYVQFLEILTFFSAIFYEGWIQGFSAYAKFAENDFLEMLHLILKDLQTPADICLKDDAYNGL